MVVTMPRDAYAALQHRDSQRVFSYLLSTIENEGWIEVADMRDDLLSAFGKVQYGKPFTEKEYAAYEDFLMSELQLRLLDLFTEWYENIPNEKKPHFDKKWSEEWYCEDIVSWHHHNRARSRESMTIENKESYESLIDSGVRIDEIVFPFSDSGPDLIMGTDGDGKQSLFVLQSQGFIRVYPALETRPAFFNAGDRNFVYQLDACTSDTIWEIGRDGTLIAHENPGLDTIHGCYDGGFGRDAVTFRGSNSHGGAMLVTLGKEGLWNIVFSQQDKIVHRKRDELDFFELHNDERRSLVLLHSNRIPLVNVLGGDSFKKLLDTGEGTFEIVDDTPPHQLNFFGRMKKIIAGGKKTIRVRLRDLIG